MASESDSRLEERYDEPKRSAFQAGYDTVLAPKVKWPEAMDLASRTAP